MKLREWILYDERTTIKDFAEEMSLSKSTIFCWMNGRKVPSKRNQARVLERTRGKVKKMKDFKDDEK